MNGDAWQFFGLVVGLPVAVVHLLGWHARRAQRLMALARQVVGIVEAVPDDALVEQRRERWDGALERLEMLVPLD